VAQMMRDIGLNVDYQAMDWGTLSSRRTSKNPVEQGGWSAFTSGPAAPDMTEPVGHLALRSNCDSAWFGWPCDATIEKLRAEFTTAPSLEARKEIARKVQERAVETVPYVPVGQFWLVRGQQASLKGLLSPGLPVYWNVSKAP